MVHFVEFGVDVGGRHHAGSGLEVELVARAQKRANHDGVVEVAVEAQVANGPAVVATGRGLQLVGPGCGGGQRYLGVDAGRRDGPDERGRAGRPDPALGPGDGAEAVHRRIPCHAGGHQG